LDKILPAYNDPLFSILIIVLLILVVAVVSFFMGNYKEEKQRKNLQIFLGKINTDDCTLDIDKLPFEESLITPLSLLADTFSTQGEYQKSIGIYLYLINNISLFSQKEHLLEGLGITYLKAGFLKRSESIFLEILRKHARNREALYHIEVVYELLYEYDKAKQTLKPLRILGENPKSLKAHLELSSLLKDKDININQKVEKLKLFANNSSYSYRRVIKELFRLNPNSAWELLDIDKIDSILDIIWFLPYSNLNFDIISKNKILSSIYIAKGVLENRDEIVESGIFVIDTINAARRGGSVEVDLNFNYGCSRCKQHFPIAFERCLKCYAIDSIIVKVSLIKKASYSGYSLL
jgi:tetratricopeptide (TPR) repeat protein